MNWVHALGRIYGLRYVYAGYMLDARWAPPARAAGRSPKSDKARTGVGGFNIVYLVFTPGEVSACAEFHLTPTEADILRVR